MAYCLRKRIQFFHSYRCNTPELAKQYKVYGEVLLGFGRSKKAFIDYYAWYGVISYGAISDELQGRHDLLEKIIGCVVDSGGDREINPKVWATAFTTALLAKPTTLASSSVEAGGGMTPSRVQEKKPLPVVFLLMLTNCISALSEKQPPCPQLYLYSTADKVISFQSVESFMEDQKKLGKKVESFNFGSSHHICLGKQLSLSLSGTVLVYQPPAPMAYLSWRYKSGNGGATRL
ncbi:hypothetical protein RJ640_011143 [Escallonia rubra]|uniref:Uncharacterized protein n=1 Tax=Escallonia rubra TaxID=112253 RepID=A0AA88U240_9ASTE|nr:hypothetical protein RJ640_011143 [Escallonia rubra]